MTLVSPRSDDLTWLRPSTATMTLKRAIDICGALGGLALLSPVFAVVAIGIKLDSRGPVLFRQERVGRGGRSFRIFKFRSMTVGAARTGTSLTVREDKRITRFGAFLRRTKLDELPQLFNVLVGDMSLVGPRPEVPEFINYYTPRQRTIMLAAKPGMTDYAAIAFRNESELLDSSRDPIEFYRRQIMPIKYAYYERYNSEIGILNDLRIILATAILLALGRLPRWLGLEDELRSLPWLSRSDSEDQRMNLSETSAAGQPVMPADRSAKGIARIGRQLIDSQVALSRAFDRLLPQSMRVDGSKDFKQRIVPSRFRDGLVIYDIGGGARPCVDMETKRRLGLTLIGLDIETEEFAKAPLRLYDKTIVADITSYQDADVADLVVCKSTLEHVSDTGAALAAMARLLRPGGTLLVFVPSRNALYARLNLVLPERVKRRLLSIFMPGKADHLGFPAKYDHCTPRDFRRVIAGQGLKIEELRPYYISSYFSYFFPVYVLWRVWILAYRAVAREQGAETFVLIAHKPDRRAQ
jgi:lipopolysaccharide/colanic/teichoic acid biosynthesis glycosyltransferase/SAM-dependent methyltransferase